MDNHRFPPFDFDSGSLQLRKHGHRLKLQRKPALILRALLEYPGEPVSRKELHSRLWPADTFVDFDLSLNVAIKKLRDCLDDSAEEPRFIETVAGFGYRFIGRCEAPEPLPVATPSRVNPMAENQMSRFTVRFATALVSLLVLSGAVYALLALSTRPTIYGASNFWKVTHSGTEKTPFTTEEERIYFFESRGDKTFFTQISVNGGEELNIPASVNVLPYQADVLQDQLVYLDGNWADSGDPKIGAQVWIRHLPAGTPLQVPNIRCNSVSWTRDGHLMCTMGGEFRIVDRQGQLVRTLFSLKHVASRAHLSPDEKTVRFDLARDNDVFKGWDIWEARADGTNLHPIAPDLQTCCGSWSTDASLYVFQAWNGDRWDIWGLSQKGGLLASKPNPVRLTSGPLDARYPKIGADGRSVFFMGADFRGELSVVDEKTGQLVPYLTGDSITQVDFSRDRRWITYVAYPEGTLWRSRPDGSERLQLTQLPVLAYNPKFSRSGKDIFFGDIGGSGKFFAVSLNGGELKPLFKKSAECVSPEDTLLDFPFVNSCPVAPGKNELRLVDPTAGTSREIPDSDGLSHMAVSPDGQLIAAVGWQPGKLRVFHMHTRRWTEISIPADKGRGWVAWSPDSESVYVYQEHDILRCRLRTGRAQLLIRLPKSPSYLWWSDWFGVSPDGKVLVTRQTGAGDIYSFELTRR
jgi:DNA-binding winged helix-turn-helix (wHTH) protein/Tol biopolymer transport system component